MVMKRFFPILAAAALLFSCSRDPRIVMVAGTYTDTGSEGLYSFAFNQQTAEAVLLDSCSTVNPSYLTFSRDGRRLYAVSELNSGNAAVYALAFDPQTGAFSNLNTQLTEGTSPCYIAANGKMAVTANYGGSLSVFPLARDGSLKPVSAVFSGSTGGPDPVRQVVPHVHCVEFSKDGKHLYASDFSADRLLCFDVIKNGSALKPATADDGQQLIVKVAPDSGPRHLIFDRKGTHAYLLGELSGQITVFDAAGGRLTARQSADADPYDGRGSADLHLSPDGRFLYASNRLIGDGIAIFAVDSRTGELTPAGYQETGRHPRHFNITPNGEYLLCACRDDDRIEIYRRDKKSGLLAPSGKSIPLRKPVCVQFAR